MISFFANVLATYKKMFFYYTKFHDEEKMINLHQLDVSWLTCNRSKAIVILNRSTKKMTKNHTDVLDKIQKLL